MYFRSLGLTLVMVHWSCSHNEVSGPTSSATAPPPPPAASSGQHTVTTADAGGAPRVSEKTGTLPLSSAEVKRAIQVTQNYLRQQKVPIPKSAHYNVSRDEKECSVYVLDDNELPDGWIGGNGVVVLLTYPELKPKEVLNLQ
jgi:hypothetical protein